MRDWKKKYLYFVLILLSNLGLSQASPNKIKVIFLSEAKLGYLLKQFDQTHIWGPLTAQHECVPMGDGCFHPQLGYVEDKRKVKKKKQKELEVKTINAEEVSLIDCDPNSQFDIFCGKAKKVENIKKPHTEIWVDTSSSMKKMDWNKNENFCERRRLVAKVKEICSEKLSVFTFDTGKKSINDLDGLCVGKGLNDGSRVINWIKNSEAKNLFIITDVDEYNGALREYLDLVNAEIIGIGTTSTMARELYSFVSEISASCK